MTDTLAPAAITSITQVLTNQPGPLSTQGTYPEPKGIKHVAGVRMSAEHGTMDLDTPNAEVKVGDKVEWHVGYTDATVVLHETMYGVRNGIVEVEWPIVGRGKLQ